MSALPLPLLPSIKGWCPSTLRPMETGDGWLVRLRLSGGAVTSGQGRAIASLALTFGNGLIDLTQRGNLQLRGVNETSFPGLIASLHELDLLNPQAEEIRTVIAPPLAGLDPSAKANGQALAGRLEASLAAEPELSGLPDKFCFLVDEGGRLGLDAITADIRLIAGDNGVIVAIASSRDTFTPIITADAPQAVDAVIALAQAFLKRGKPAAAKRMSELVRTIGTAGIARAAGLPFDADIALPPRCVTHAHDVIGLHEGFIGVAGPFGRLTAEQMQRLADLAPNGLRLTPWRCILVPDAKQDILAVLEHAGLIVSSGDARLMIVACPGRPACGAAQIDTRSVANALAPIAQQWGTKGIALHISGCHKGCAHAAPAPLTLVGRDGKIDLILNGRADGRPHSSGLELSHVIDALDALHGERLSS